MIKIKLVRNILLGIFAVVGVFQLHQTLTTSTPGEINRTIRSAEFRQDVTELKLIRIRTISEGKYCIAPYVIQTNSTETERITLVLHMSSDRYNEKKLREHAKNWGGPMSIAMVFPPDVTIDSDFVQCTVKKLQLLRLKDANIANQLNVHFIFQNVDCEAFTETDYFNNKEAADSLNCTISHPHLTIDQQALMLTNYPVNKARNVARKFAATKYILSADLDHLFSRNFEKKVLGLAKDLLTKEPKTVLVYRIFEISEKVKKQAQTKTDLQKLFFQYQAQEFHKYYGAHNIPQLYEWFKEPENEEKATVQFYRPYVSHAWEPQFVALNNIPYHDENFKYPTRDNTVLRWEMCRAGYKFAVVNDVFMFHNGFKQKDELDLVNKARVINRKGYFKLLQTFRNRMDKQYSKTKYKCPNFDYYSY